MHVLICTQINWVSKEQHMCVLVYNYAHLLPGVTKPPRHQKIFVLCIVFSLALCLFVVWQQYTHMHTHTLPLHGVIACQYCDSCQCYNG